MDLYSAVDWEDNSGETEIVARWVMTLGVDDLAEWLKFTRTRGNTGCYGSMFDMHLFKDELTKRERHMEKETLRVALQDSMKDQHTLIEEEEEEARMLKKAMSASLAEAADATMAQQSHQARADFKEVVQSMQEQALEITHEHPHPDMLEARRLVAVQKAAAAQAQRGIGEATEAFKVALADNAKQRLMAAVATASEPGPFPSQVPTQVRPAVPVPHPT